MSEVRRDAGDGAPAAAGDEAQDAPAAALARARAAARERGLRQIGRAHV